MSYLYVFVGLILLFLGGELLVRGSVALALKLGVSKLIVAVVLVGFGTSAPEVLVSIESAVLGHPELALGNAVGSNIANILLIVGVSAAIAPVVVKRAQVNHDMWLVLLVTAAFVAAGLISELTFWHGLVMLTCLGIYVCHGYRRARRTDTADLTAETEIDPETMALSHAIVFAIVGLILLIVGADRLVAGAVLIAHELGVPEAVIGLTIVAIGSSLPELAICAAAARRREPLVAIGNVLGSNIFNLLGAMGVVALITNVGIAETMIGLDLVIMLAMTVALAILLLYVNRIGRTTGLCFVGAYCLYLAGQFDVF